MTTDPFPKEAAVRVETGAGTFHVGGMTKGSGMIEPMMATMLGFLTCDAQVEPALLKKALNAAMRDTFNAITVDGECSTNDTVFALSSGASGVVVDESLYPAFEAGLRAVSKELALGIVRGGEGATKLVSIRVTGAYGVGARRTCSPDHRKLAAGQDGDARRRPELGPAGRGSRPLRRAVRPVACARFTSGASYCSRRGSRTTTTREKQPFICRARISISRSISAPAETNRPQSGRAISVPST